MGAACGLETISLAVLPFSSPFPSKDLNPPCRVTPWRLRRDAPSNSPLVLIIEGEQPIRRFLRAPLESQGCRVKEAITANDGLMQARTQRPDPILLDLGLPDGDGLEVTKSIRADSAVPIVVLSARGQEHDQVAALDSGVDDYLTKPFGVSELTARIRIALRHAARPASSTESVYEATMDGRTLRFDPDRSKKPGGNVDD